MARHLGQAGTPPAPELRPSEHAGTGAGLLQLVEESCNALSAGYSERCAHFAERRAEALGRLVASNEPEQIALFGAQRGHHAIPLIGAIGSLSLGSQIVRVSPGAVGRVTSHTIQQ